MGVGGASVPAVGVVQAWWMRRWVNDDGVGQGDGGLDHPGAAFGADGEHLEASVVPGVGPFDHPPLAYLEGEPLDADDAGAAELGEQVTGLSRVIAGEARFDGSTEDPILRVHPGRGS